MGIRRKKTLTDQAHELVETVIPPIEHAVDVAREKAGPVIADARDKAGPVIADARDKAGPILADAREVAAEKAAQGKEFAEAMLAEVKGQEPEPVKKKGRKRKILLLGALAAAAGFAYKKLQGGSADSNWQTSYTPTPAPTPAPAPAPAPAADDLGAASPDEALSDAAESPHDTTTPDDPAEVVDIEGAEEPDERA